MKKIPTSSSFSRRRFLQAGTAVSAAMILPRRVFGANERIGIGMIGLNGIGNMHLGQFRKMDDVDVIGLCDVDTGVRDRVAQDLDPKPVLTSDFRELLERKDIDAVVAAVPDHWHAYIALSAFEAGKDAYIEKPLGHNIREGRLIVEAAKDKGRVMQTGLQQRSGPHWQHAVERIKNGEIGKVHNIHMWNAWNTTEMRGDMGEPPDSPAPEGVDYDRWLGAAPGRPFNKARFHGSWYFFWDYSGGMISTWGVHLFDIVLWAMGNEINSVSTVGGIYVLDDLRETPDTSESIFDCPGYSLSYTVRHANGWRTHGDMDHGIQFFGTTGVLEINRQGFEIYHEKDRTTRKTFYTEARADNGQGALTSYWFHKINFLDCMRSREQPAASAEVGHHSSIPGHLGNISYRVGRSIKWDSEKETIVGDEEAEKLLRREYREPWVL